MVETYQYIEFVDGYFVTAKQTWEVQMKMRDDNGKHFIFTLYNVLFTLDLCNKLFSIIELMNLGNTWLFHKGVFTVFFSDN